MTARLTAATLACVVLVSGCSLGEKEDWAETIVAAYDMALEAGTAEVTFSSRMRSIETNIRELPDPLLARASGVAHFGQRYANLAITEPAKTRMLFRGLSVFLPRSEASRGISPERWARFDFAAEPSEDIDANDRRVAIGIAAISPTVAAELLPGLLTGSIEQGPTERRGGVDAVRYDARLAPDAANREIDDETREEGILRLFETLGINQDVFDVSVWIGPDGKLRGLRFVVIQEKDRVNRFELTMDWSFPSYGRPVSVSTPRADNLLTSTRFRDFVSEHRRELVSF